MIITLANQKGGVGKSMLTVNLAAALYETIKESVTIVDLDDQGTAMSWVNKGALPVKVLRRAEAEDLGQDGFILLDTPGKLHDLSVQKAISIADMVVIPCNSSPGAMPATVRTIEVVRQIHKKEPFVVLTDLRAGTVMERAILDWSKSLNAPVAKTVLHRREIFPQSQVMGEWVKSGPAREELLALLTELLHYGRKR